LPEKKILKSLAFFLRSEFFFASLIMSYVYEKNIVYITSSLTAAYLLMSHWEKKLWIENVIVPWNPASCSLMKNTEERERKEHHEREESIWRKAWSELIESKHRSWKVVQVLANEGESWRPHSLPKAGKGLLFECIPWIVSLWTTLLSSFCNMNEAWSALP